MPLGVLRFTIVSIAQQLLNQSDSFCIYCIGNLFIAVFSVYDSFVSDNTITDTIQKTYNFSKAFSTYPW